jgi:OmpA-OmpF porin, OOP family
MQWLAKRLVMGVLGLAMGTPAWAQSGIVAQAGGTLSPEQMVEQLKAPRTRSLRNLTVEAVPQNNAAAVSNNANASTSTVTSVTTAVPTAAATPAQAAPATPQPKPSLSLLIQFDFNSARVKPESQQALANLAKALQSQELLGSKFAIEGHTDAQGRADYNQRLSHQRADAVRDLLVVQGVSRQRLQTAGKGSAELANATDPHAAENRRVRIVNVD